MPLRYLPILVLLLLPLAAAAECGFAEDARGLTIVVRGKSDSCFQSAAFRTAFRNNLVASVKTMNQADGAERGQQKPVDARSARAAKLWAIAERSHQSSLAAASYYGQR